MPLPRFRIRTLLIAVAVAAIMLAGVATVRTLRSLHEWYENRISLYETLESLETTWVDYWNCSADSDETLLKQSESTAGDEGYHKAAKAAIVEYRAYAAQSAARVKFYAAMKSKYRHAARYPWLPVPPDPPEPN